VTAKQDLPFAVTSGVIVEIPRLKKIVANKFAPEKGTIVLDTSQARRGERI
jgi:hypothetical protein